MRVRAPTGASLEASPASFRESRTAAAPDAAPAQAAPRQLVMPPALPQTRRSLSTAERETRSRRDAAPPPSYAPPSGMLTPHGSGPPPQCIRALSPVPGVMRSSSRGANLAVGRDSSPAQVRPPPMYAWSPRVPHRHVPHAGEPRIAATPPSQMQPQVPYGRQKSPSHARLAGVPPFVPLGRNHSRPPPPARVHPDSLRYM